MIVSIEVTRVYLAYLDDSGTDDRKNNFQVVAAVIVPAQVYLMAEVAMAATAFMALPEEQREKYEEFHASEVFWGKGPWIGVEQTARFQATLNLIGLVSNKASGVRVVYASVNKAEFSQKPSLFADPLDMAFAGCVELIAECIIEMAAEGVQKFHVTTPALCIAIADNGKHNLRLGETYRRIRGAHRFGGHPTIANAFRFTETVRFPLIDDLYFGNSKHSVGIQMSDLCAYLINCHLRQRPKTEPFFVRIEPAIARKRNYPE